MVAEFLNRLQEICKVIFDYALVLFYARAIPDWDYVSWVYGIVAFFLGSAFLAATVAETRRHNMFVHFFLGLALPYGYPVFLFFKLKTAQKKAEELEEIDPLAGISSVMTDRLKDIRDNQQKSRAGRIKRKGAEGEINSKNINQKIRDAAAKKDTSESDEQVQEGAPEFTQRFFQEIAVDSAGVKAGPFILIAKNGNEFLVRQITTIQKDMASFQVDVNGNLKNIRFKYDNIESFKIK